MTQTSMTAHPDMSTLKSEVLDACKNGITLKLLSDATKGLGLRQEKWFGGRNKKSHTYMVL